MKNYWPLVFLLSFCGRCLPLRIDLSGSLKEMAVLKKIKLRVVLEDQEAAVYSDQINFSIDGDAITLHKPTMLATSTQEFIPLNKSIKAIYQSAFNVEIKVESQLLKSLKELLGELEKSKVFMSTLVLCKDGTTQSKTVFIALNHPPRKLKNKQKEPELPADGRFVQTSTLLEDGFNWHEILLFDQLGACWIVLVDGVCYFFSSDWFFLLYVLLFVALFFWGIFRVLPFTCVFLCNAAWKREVAQGFMLFEMGLSFKFMQFFCGLHYVFYSLAAFSLIVGLFYVRSKYPAESILSKFRITIGLILIGFVLPLLTKGWMISLRRYL